MKCTDAQDLLSAYYDHELNDPARTHVREHLEECAACAEELARFGELSALTLELPPLHTPDIIRHQLSAALDAERPSRRSHWYSALTSSRTLAVAATLLVAVALGWFAYSSWSEHSNHHLLVADFQQYLDEFHRDPTKAQQMLVAKYNGVAVDPARAFQLVGYHPAAANAPQDEFVIKSTHVLKMPCCTCVQTVCERRDGSTIAIFEHDDANPEWFGSGQGTTADCCGKQCRLLQFNDRIAASWNAGERHFTVVGARDEEDVSNLVTWLGSAQRDEASQARSS